MAYNVLGLGGVGHCLCLPAGVSRMQKEPKPARPRLPDWHGEPVLTWMEYVARDQPAPVGVGIPGFLYCEQCEALLVYTKLDVYGERWEWRSPVLGNPHHCGEL